MLLIWGEIEVQESCDPLAELPQKCRFMALEVLGFQLILVFPAKDCPKNANEMVFERNSP